MKQAQRSPVDIVRADDKVLVAVCRRFLASAVNNGFLVPTAGYTVGTVQIVNQSGTLSTGVITEIVSNDPSGDEFESHPSASTFSAAGTKGGFALEHAYFGVNVTTAQASIVVDVFVTLKA